VRWLVIGDMDHSKLGRSNYAKGHLNCEVHMYSSELTSIHNSYMILSPFVSSSSRLKKKFQPICVSSREEWCPSSVDAWLLSQRMKFGTISLHKKWQQGIAFFVLT
jgi:hypothetical protein